MALKVEIQKDMDEYKPKIIAGLTKRSLVCITLAIGGSILIGGYCWWVLGIPDNLVSTIVVFCTAPLWLAGFWQPMGMDAEKFLPLWIRQHFGKTKLFYEAPAYRSGEAECSPKPAIPDETYLKLAKRFKRGFEAHRPTDFAFE